MNTNELIERKVREFDLGLYVDSEGVVGVHHQERGNLPPEEWVEQALQEVADDTEKRVRREVFEMVNIIHFRDMQPGEARHKYLQQEKGAEYLRKKIKTRLLQEPLPKDLESILRDPEGIQKALEYAQREQDELLQEPVTEDHESTI